MEIIGTLDLPAGHYAVFGGAILAMLDIREANDIDLFVDDLLFKRFVSDGWQTLSENGRPSYVSTVIDSEKVQAFRVWEGGDWRPDINSYISDPQVIEGIPFMPLDELYKWKYATRRPKDLEDLEFIDSYREAF